MSDTEIEKNDCVQNNCGCPPAAKQPFRLRDIFKKSAACCCGTAAGGFLLGHASCLITPLVIAFTGAVVSGAGAGLLAVGISAGVTAGGLALWHKIRGQKADASEKRNVLRGALIGFGLSAVFNLAFHKHHHGNHHQPADPRFGREVTMCGVPPRADTTVVKKADDQKNDRPKIVRPKTGRVSR